MINDPLTLTALTQALHPRSVKVYPSISSTNDVALVWLSDGAEAGSIVVAEEQTKGRGRLGRSWFAPPGTALMFSVILKPAVEAVGRISMLGAVCVCDVLRDMGLQTVGIKWPNDVQIIVDGVRRKLCGVLPESIWDGSGFVGAVLGIGINVRVDFKNTPFSETAASIESVLGKPVDRIHLLKQILAKMDKWESQIGCEAFIDAWRSRLNMMGQPVMIEGERCIAHDVEHDGTLIVRRNDGSLRRIIAGDIALGSE